MHRNVETRTSYPVSPEYDTQTVAAAALPASMQAFLSATEGAPASLMHEGPLHHEDLSAVHTQLTSATMKELLHTTYGGALRSAVPRGLASLWPDSVVQRYTEAVVRARRERVESQRAASATRTHTHATAQRVDCGVDEDEYDANRGPHVKGREIKDADCCTHDNSGVRGTRRRAAHRLCAAIPRYTSGHVAQTVFCPHTADASSADAATHWASLLHRYAPLLPTRSVLHELENLPQEMALVELMQCCVRALHRCQQDVLQTVKDDDACLHASHASSVLRNEILASFGSVGTDIGNDTNANTDHEEKRRPDAEGAGACATISCVVDVGGGNGFLATLARERLRCRVVIVDPHVPAHAVDVVAGQEQIDATAATAAAKAPLLRRWVGFVQNMCWHSDVAADPDHSIVVAKHLCGSAMDVCLRRCEEQDCLPRALVFAPCCFNKIEMDRYVDEAYLQARLRLGSPSALQRVARLTDWNCSCHACVNECKQQQKEQQHGQRTMSRNETQQSRLVPETWQSFGFAAAESGEEGPVAPRRRGSARSTVRLLPCMHGFAQYVEALLNHGRVEWLKERGYGVCVMQYVPSCVTPKNKCIVAIRPHRARRVMA